MFLASAMEFKPSADVHAARCNNDLNQHSVRLDHLFPNPTKILLFDARGPDTSPAVAKNHFTITFFFGNFDPSCQCDIPQPCTKPLLLIVSRAASRATYVEVRLCEQFLEQIGKLGALIVLEVLVCPRLQ